MRITGRPCNRDGFTANRQTADYHAKTSGITPWRLWTTTAITTLAMTTAALAGDGEETDWPATLIAWGVLIAVSVLWSAIFPPKKKKNGESDDDGPDFEFRFTRRRGGSDGDGDGDGGGGCGGGCGGGD